MGRTGGTLETNNAFARESARERERERESAREREREEEAYHHVEVFPLAPCRVLLRVVGKAQRRLQRGCDNVSARLQLGDVSSSVKL